MTRRWLAGGVAGVAGAVAAVAAFSWASVRHPGVTFEMDRNLPVAAAGVYPAERAADATWVWTAPRARIELVHADRSVDWTCRFTVRGGRPPSEPLPRVTLSVDGVALATSDISNEWQELTVTAPPRPERRGLTIGIDTSETFRPPGDPRELGVLVDRLTCLPAPSASPPGGGQMETALAAGTLGLAAGVAGVPLTIAAGVAAAVGALQALPLATGGAAFTDFPLAVPWLALWVGLGLLAATGTVRAMARAPLSAPAYAVLAGSAGVLHLKLLALLHPSKPIIDALFHAHRFDLVQAGQFYFTQTMPNGVEFPYAIALYVAAVPWSVLTADHVALLRVVTTTAEVLSGMLLYVVALRVREDRTLGVFAVALFHAVPIAYPVIGNANLTNAFGQSAALAAMAVAIAAPLTHVAWVALLAAVLAVALLSHVSTFMLTAATVGSLGAVYWWRGGDLRPAGLRVLLALAAAVVVAVVLYWGHFGDTYRTLAAVRAETAAADLPSIETASRPFVVRVATALQLARTDLGWPLMLLAALGLGVVARARRLDRITLAIAAWAAAYVAFLTVGLFAPVSGSYERYAAEFIGRVDLAVYPAVVLLGAAATAWMWRQGAGGRFAAVASVVWVALGAFAQWRGWIL